MGKGRMNNLMKPFDVIATSTLSRRMNSPDGARLKPSDERKVVLVVAVHDVDDPNAVVIAASAQIEVGAVSNNLKDSTQHSLYVVGSVVGSTDPANHMPYAATKAYINSFASSLRVRAAPSGIDVINMRPYIIDPRMKQKMRSHGSTVPEHEFGNPDTIARKMMKAVDDGGVGMVTWPSEQGTVPMR
ncbi:hypothetical protein BJ165DRAFT_1543038 [Panaeolus papilionaceus]|nr:hypothetical protein BJ165DRAFT_1543038 [Panaeolus papilionaceus]